MVKKNRNEKYIFVTNKRIEVENIVFSKKFLKKKYIYYGVNKNKKECSFLSIPVAYCPYCHKMEPIYKFFVAKEEKNANLNNDSVNLASCLELCFDIKKCKKYFEARQKKSQYEFDDILDFILKCPNCHKDLKNQKTKFLYTSRKHEENTVFHSYDIYKKGDKIILKSTFKYFYPNTNAGKIGISFYDIYLSINLKTGHSYLTSPRVNGKPMKGCSYMSSDFTDCTYFKYALQAGLNKIFTKKKSVINDLGKIFFENKKTKYSFNNEQLSIEQIIYINRFPDFDINTISNIMHILNSFSSFEISYGSHRNKILTFFRSIKTNEKFEIMNIIKKFKLPDKPKLRKLATINPTYLFWFYMIKKLPFKNYDIQFNIIENYNEILQEICFSKEIIFFLKDLIKNKGETYAYNCVFSSEKAIYMFLKDTSSMYIKLYDKEQVNFKGSLKDMHDNFSLLCQKQKNNNITFNYSKNNKKLEDTINEIDFFLPANSDCLIDVGYKMHICVGSYSSRVYTKNCIIILMLKQKKYIGCLELSSTGKKLLQAKGPCNQIIDQEAAIILDNYLKKHNINFSNCYDYKNMAEQYTELVI